jgi:hypothetical protein
MLDAVFMPIIGGVLIGTAALLLMALNGRIAGICSIVAGAILPGKDDRAWRWVFMLGLLAGTWLCHELLGLPVPTVEPSQNALVIISGLLVGYGTQLGSGCTSGHGVCGLGRLSLRSLVATLVFMFAGVVTVSLMRHVFV